MATSGTRTFNLVRDEIIEEAYELLGIKDENEPLTPGQVASAARTFEMMLKAVQAKGLYLWTWEETTIAAVNGTRTYQIDRVLDIDEDAILRTVNNIDHPLQQISEEEYTRMPNKLTTGLPVQFYIEKGLSTDTVYFWPVPDSSDYDAILSCKKPIEDIGQSENNIDAPPEMLEYLALALAYRLAPKFGIPIIDRQDLGARAQMAEDALLDNEGMSFQVQPDLGRR